MFDWYASMDRPARRTFWASFAGWSLDAFDAQIYSFVVPALIALWGITKTQAGLLATSALLISAFGGWAGGVLSDRIGRVRLLQLTIVWFAVFTFLSGFTQNFGQLMVVRGLQGFGFGAEWAAGAVLIGEAVQARYRGRAVGAVQSAWSFGWAAAAILSAVIFQTLPPQVAWRAMFFMGILPAVSVVLIRRAVPEPEIFEKARSAPPARIGAIFAPDLLRSTVLGSLLAVGVQGGYYAITTWLPTFLRTERHLSVIGSSLYLGVIIFGSFLGYISSAYLSDMVGRRRNFFIFAVGSVAVVLAYTQLQISNLQMLWLGLPLGFFASGSFSGMGPLYTELFPTRVRGGGQGFCYNFGRGLASIFPTLVGLLSTRLPLGAAIGAFAVGAYLLMIAAAMLLPETRGRELDAVGA
ncbi:MAG: mmlH1 [Caulobacteraceae bacterium]|nr:mmlH1 [Caulobacteraceae bacterium]